MITTGLNINKQLLGIFLALEKAPTQKKEKKRGVYVVVEKEGS